MWGVKDADTHTDVWAPRKMCPVVMGGGAGPGNVALVKANPVGGGTGVNPMEGGVGTTRWGADSSLIASVTSASFHSLPLDFFVSTMSVKFAY
jgi:hypothetical protein